MKRTQLKLWPGLAVAAISVLPAAAQPQPPAGNPGGGQNFGDMTPEQRQQFFLDRVEKQREDTAILTLNDTGFTDKAVQDAVVDFLKEQSKTRQPIGQMTQKLSLTLRDKNATADDVAKQLTDLRAAVKVEKARTETAEKALDAKIGYSKDARLEAVLVTLNVIGDESSYGNSGLGAYGFGNGGFGGRGGFGGGRR